MQREAFNNHSIQSERSALLPLVLFFGSFAGERGSFEKMSMRVPCHQPVQGQAQAGTAWQARQGPNIISLSIIRLSQNHSHPFSVLVFWFRTHFWLSLFRIVVVH
jgi:hypothetical protein